MVPSVFVVFPGHTHLLIKIALSVFYKRISVEPESTYPSLCIANVFIRID